MSNGNKKYNKDLRDYNRPAVEPEAPPVEAEAPIVEPEAPPVEPNVAVTEPGARKSGFETARVRIRRTGVFNRMSPTSGIKDELNKNRTVKVLNRGQHWCQVAYTENDDRKTGYVRTSTLAFSE